MFFDTVLNSVMFARLLAAFGETCFIIQLNIWLSTSTNCFASTVSLVLLAQTFATYGTYRKKMVCFLYEEIIWTILFIILGSHYKYRMLALPPVVYMVVEYIPYCYKSWKESIKQTKPMHFPTFLKSFYISNPSREWSSWKADVSWITVYFLFGGLVSLHIVEENQN